ncbi:MAG: hypothetical protein ACTTJ3_05705 [Treponema sp.]
MIYYFNRPLILEQAVKDAFIEYFEALKASEYYKNYSINITNEHPFSLMLPDFVYNRSLFPSIVISTVNDNKPSELNMLSETRELILVKEDLEELEKHGYMVCDEVIKELEEVFKTQNEIIGVTKIIRRQEKIAIEIWSENIQLKNELYELIRLFIAGSMRDAMAKYRDNNNLVIFDHTLEGDRSGNYNYDFGVTLVGARITFNADYFIEQSVVDTELKNKNIIWEVKNYVKRQ